MARLLGPDPATRFAVRFTAARQTEGMAGKALTVYTDEALTQLADLAEYDPESPAVPGAAVAGSKVRVDDNSFVPLFWFPDGVDTLWAQTVEGYRLRLTADVDARLDRIQLGWVNVRAFGAAGDGEADDTAALLAAIAALPEGGGVVYLPAGRYVVDDVLVVSSGTALVGDGQYATVIEQTNPAKQAVYGADITGGLMIRDLRLTGPSDGSTPGTSDAILLEQTGVLATQNVVIENVYIDHWSRHGVVLEDPITSTLRNVRVQTCAGDGFRVNLGTSLTFDSCYANGLVGTGYRLTSTSYSHLTGCAADSCAAGYLLTGCNSLTLASCGTEALTGNGFTITGGTGSTLTSCYSSGNPAIGFHVTGEAARVTLAGVWERNPSGTPTASIQVAAGCTATVVNPIVTTAEIYAAGTTQLVAPGQLAITSAGTSINGVDRAAVTNFAAYVLRTAGADRWALQMVNNSTNDVQLTDSANGGVAFLAESRATATNLSLLTATKSYGGGVGVLFLGNASTPPASNPTGGGIIYVQGGALMFRGSGGTITELGPA